VTTYTTSLPGCRNVNADSTDEAAAIFAARYARRTWGRSTYTAVLREECRDMSGGTVHFEATFGHSLPQKWGGGTSVDGAARFSVSPA